MFGTILMFIKFNNVGTWCLNGPRHLFLSFCCSTRSIISSCLYLSPALIRINTVCVYIMYIHTHQCTYHYLECIVFFHSSSKIRYPCMVMQPTRISKITTTTTITTPLLAGNYLTFNKHLIM